MINILLDIHVNNYYSKTKIFVKEKSLFLEKKVLSKNVSIIYLIYLMKRKEKRLIRKNTNVTIDDAIIINYVIWLSRCLFQRWECWGHCSWRKLISTCLFTHVSRDGSLPGFTVIERKSWTNGHFCACPIFPFFIIAH